MDAKIYTTSLLAFMEKCVARGHTLSEVHTYLESSQDVATPEWFFGCTAQQRYVDFMLFQEEAKEE